VIRIATIAALALAASGAQAQLYKCVGADGKTAYQSEPCAGSAKSETKIRAPASTNVVPSSSPSSRRGSSAKETNPWQAGWANDELAKSANGCVSSIANEAQERAGGKRRTYPEGLMAEASRYCNCLAHRLGSGYTRAEYAKSKDVIDEGLRKEAAEGGDCKPQGALADFMAPPKSAKK
jgi:hypothetical protein